MKNFKEKLTKILELDNKEKYQNGYYQLSNQQKLYWVIALFLVGLIFFIIRANIVGNINGSAVGVTFISLIISSMMFIIISFLAALIFYYPFFIFSSKDERKKAIREKIITLFQVWTICAISIILIISYSININPTNLIIAFFTVQFIRIAYKNINNKNI